MDWEAFYYLPTLEQVRCVIKALQTSMMELFGKIATLI